MKKAYVVQDGKAVRVSLLTPVVQPEPQHPIIKWILDLCDKVVGTPQVAY